VAKHADPMGFAFGRQAGFHDHIIRNDAAYRRINDYIGGYSSFKPDGLGELR